MIEGVVAASDIIDVRPRVVPFDVATATVSPFEYNATFAKHKLFTI